MNTCASCKHFRSYRDVYEDEDEPEESGFCYLTAPPTHTTADSIRPECYVHDALAEAHLKANEKRERESLAQRIGETL